jgi:UDP-N-acetylmuramoyl-tripeptide--D-alanyl-D-alanine ligase
MTSLMTVTTAARWLSQARLVGDGEIGIQRVHTDTRTVEPEDLFVALKGERYDANHFLLDAQRRGAVAAICHPQAAGDWVPQGMVRIEVPDTKVALGELASGWRSQFTLPLIAVTGSNGKTTVTQMIASILSAHCATGADLATRGNLNNEIGVPLTLLRLRPHHAMACVELGMNHPGEIASLAGWARPTVALVNNAQREHLEFMHTVQAVAQENGAVIAALGAQGVAVIPLEDEYAALWRSVAGKRRVVQFGLDCAASDETLACTGVHWEDGAWQIRAKGLGVELTYRLAIAGRHNVKNSLAAAACGLAAGASAEAVERGLNTFTPVKGRSKAMSLQSGGRTITLVDDTYNANPDSVRAAVDVLAELPGPRLLVLGDMGEVGQQGLLLHAEAAHYAKSQGIEALWLLGNLSRAATSQFPGSRHFEDHAQLNAAILDILPNFSSVLVKGSRFMQMERVVECVMGASKCC